MIKLGLEIDNHHLPIAYFHSGYVLIQKNHEIKKKYLLKIEL